LIVGAGGVEGWVVTVSVCVLDVPPFGAGVTTVTLSAVGNPTSAARRSAVSWELDTKVVGRALPFT